MIRDPFTSLDEANAFIGKIGNALAEWQRDISPTSSDAMQAIDEIFADSGVVAELDERDD
jgi:hypothetical protein